MPVKIDDVERKYKNRSKGTITERVYKYLNDHPEEVFRYDEESLQEGLPDDKMESINYALWQLEKDERIKKLKLAPKVVYFGSRQAIDSLAKRLNNRRGPS